LLEHGGRLNQAVAKYDIPLAQWLDLSTGINPQGYPVSPLPPDVWRCLPQTDDGLIAAAQTYYGADSVLPVAGSQAAIQLLPLLCSPCRVGIPTPSYAEHHHAWSRSGHTLIDLDFDHIDDELDALDVLVLVNPNNPTGRRFDAKSLLAWHERLSQHGGWLVVDEAFIDSRSEDSLVRNSHREGLIVLRSFGKFFGMAGARVGFVFANEKILTPLEEELGPWAISGPSRMAAIQALQDKNWQFATCQRLQQGGERLASLLTEVGLTVTGATDYFSWIKIESARDLHEALAQRGIFTRYFSSPASIRFGLPGNAEQWSRLAVSLSEILGRIKE